MMMMMIALLLPTIDIEKREKKKKSPINEEEATTPVLTSVLTAKLFLKIPTKKYRINIITEAIIIIATHFNDFFASFFLKCLLILNHFNASKFS